MCVFMYVGSVFPLSVFMSSYLMEIDLTAHPGVWPLALIYTNTKDLDALLTEGAPF